MPSKSAINKQCLEKEKIEKELNQNVFPLIKHLVKKYNSNKKITLTKPEEIVVSDILNEFGFEIETKKLIKKIIIRVYDRKIYEIRNGSSMRGGSKSLVRYGEQSPTKTLFTRFNLSVLVMFICAMVVLIAAMTEFRIFFETIDPSTENEPFFVFIQIFYSKLFDKKQLVTNMITTAASRYAETLTSNIEMNCMRTDSVSNSILTTVMSLLSPNDITSCMIRESKFIMDQQISTLESRLKMLMIPLVWSMRVIVLNGAYLTGVIVHKAIGSTRRQTIRNSDDNSLTGGRKNTTRKNRK